MEPALAIGLLALAVGAILVARPRWLAWVVPPALAGLAVATGIVHGAAAERSLRPLADPVAFVVLAVPFAVLLDRFGFFTQLAERIGGARHALGAFWTLAALVVALLNLDAAVVLLTPLYLRIASHRDRPRIQLAFQPLLCSCLASSAVPISNLTNLIAASSLRLSTGAFLVHLGLPTVAASVAGYVAYRRLGDRLAALDDPAASVRASRGALGDLVASRRRHGSGRPERSPRRLVAGGALVVAVAAGFLVAPSLGGQPWEVAAAGDVLLVAATRTVPLATVPWRIVLTVAGLGVLAGGAAGPLHVASLLGGSGLASIARDTALGTVSANVVNNLPALLVALPGLARHGGVAPWAFLLGDNVGPLVLPTGSLAGLLWMETMRRLGAPVGDGDYLRIGWRVAVVSLAAATGMLVVAEAFAGSL